MQVQFNCKKHFYFELIQFSQAILIQLIQFSKSTDFVYAQLHVRTETIQFSGKTVLFEVIQFSTSTQFKM